MANATNDIEAVALLDEPVRRALYDWVIGQPEAVSRDAAAAATGISRALAAFHLDRLVAHDLLGAEYRRLSGRTGPGAGRPAKLYRRGSRDVTVSLPDRRYEVAAAVMADAMEHMGRSPLDALETSARAAGRAVGEDARKAAGRRPGRRRARAALLDTLRQRGYGPREAPSGEIRLTNCPFHALVAEHRDLVCGMNLALADGLVSALGEAGLEPRLDPKPGECCVAFVPPG